MRQALSTTDLSLAESLRVALEGEDIDTIITSQNATGLPVSPLTIAILDDREYDRARAILETLRRTTPELVLGTMMPRRAFRAFLSVLVAILAVMWIVAVLR